VSSKEYREFADECLHWAKTARSDREKRIFLQMAETRLKAAVLADRREQREATAQANNRVLEIPPRRDSPRRTTGREAVLGHGRDLCAGDLAD